MTSELEVIQPYCERRGYFYHCEESSAFCAAAAGGHITVVKLLLSQLHNMAISKPEVVTAFQEACMNGRAEVVSQLLSDQVEVGDLKPAMEAAAFRGHLTVVNLLIDHENRLGLTRVETIRLIRPAANGSIFEYQLALESSIQVCRSTYLVITRAHF